MACERCGGSGKVRYSILPSRPDAVDLGGGVSVKDMGGSGTRACVCVRDLPPTAGHASWWETETIWSDVVPVPIGDGCVEITADGEVPRREDGRRVHRTQENAYYPALIRVSVAGDMTLHPEDARALAAALIVAAQACEERDGSILPF